MKEDRLYHPSSACSSVCYFVQELGLLLKVPVFRNGIKITNIFRMREIMYLSQSWPTLIPDSYFACIS